MATGSEGFVMEPVSTSDEEVLKSHLGLDTSAQPKLQEPDNWPGAGRHDDEFKRPEDQRTFDEKDRVDRNGPKAGFCVELESGQEGELREEGVGQSGEDTGMLIDSSKSEGEDVMGGSVVQEENDVMDTAEMCYDSVVFPTLPPEGDKEPQEAPLEYRETYLSSLGERERMLLSTVPAPSSPSSYFQASNMDVAPSTAVTASWDELHSTRAESEYGAAPSSSEGSDDASPGGGNSTEDRAFVDSLCEEPSKVDCLETGNDPSLSGPLCENRGTKNPRFEAFQSSGGSDPENEYSSVLTTEDMAYGGGEGASDALPRKEKAPVGELSLRSVLSDPYSGAFMDDAMVAMCGHSFGSASLQRVLDTHSCINCGASVLLNTVVPNLALRAAVLAYKQEDQFWQLSSIQGTKRQREQFDMLEGSEPGGTVRDHVGSAENAYADSFRSKGVQFPFAVSDRVLIKGNKRTPERFVGMEGIIMNQSLNGWYLVRTLDTGESVRLQYRSLQKRGEMEFPSTSEARLMVEQRTDSIGSPLDIDSLKGYPSGPKSASEYGPESMSLASQQEHPIVTSAYPCIAAEGVNPDSSKRESNAPINQSILAVDAGSSSRLDDGTATNYSWEVLEEQEGRDASNMNVVDGQSSPRDQSGEQVLDASENLKGAGQVKTFNEGSQKSRFDLLRMNPAPFQSHDAQLVHTGFNHDTEAKFSTGTSVCCIETPVSATGQGRPNNVSTDLVGDAQDVGEFPAVERDQTNGNESFRKCSKRTGLQFKSSAVSGNFLQDSDPYRKVYTSGSHRRNTKGDSVVTVIPDHVPADSKSLLKGTNGTGKSSEKAHLKGSSVGPSGPGKQEREKKLRSANEILQIMRKDMLKFENQIPRNYLLRSWRVHRGDWQRNVKASDTVSALGAQVQDFRYSLLLTTAGGMSDEEWDMRIALIIKSGDVELLVSLWGRLYTDVHKWLESRPKALRGKDIQLGRPLADDQLDFLKQGPDVSVGAISSVHMTTAAALAAVDAVAEGQQDPDTSIKALLTTTMDLLQQQSRTELSAVSEALEREKRHITAKLAHLEGQFANLRGNSDLNTLEHDPVLLPGLLNRSETGQSASASIVPVSRGIARVSLLASRQGYETEEGDSDIALPTRDADGEATDMSDSD